MARGSVRLRAIPPRWRTPAEAVLVALGYYLCGRLALLLAIPPGSATAVWPASGLALAAVLLIGPRVWPGILLGAFAVRVGTWFDPSSTAAVIASVGLPLLIGAGAALQALVGGSLVRRMAGYPNTLANESDVLRFLLLGGPVSSLIGASVGVAGLLMFGAIPGHEIVPTWGAWWVRDTIGTALFAPLALLWCTSPVLSGLRRKISVTVPMCLIFGLAVVLFLQVGAREQERLETDFERRADDLAHRLRRSFDGSLDVLESLGSFCDATHRIDRREFNTFARSAISRSRSVQALTWNPRVKDSERTECIRAARLEVEPGFQILERDSRGTFIPAARRDEYAPAYYVEPLEGPECVLGFDASSDPDRREALLRARDSGAPAATAPIQLGPNGDRQLALLVFRPIFGRGEPHESVSARRTSVAGYATAVFRISDMLEEALAGVDVEFLQIELWDVTGPSAERVLYQHRRPDPEEGVPSPSRGDREIRPRSARYPMAGRVWEMRFQVDPAHLSAQRSWQAWGVLAGGLLFTGFLGAFLLVVTGRADAIQELVARRTSELEQANAELRHEVAERARAEEEHQMSEARLAAAQQVAHLGSWELDMESHAIVWSDELYRIHGLAPGEVSIDYEQFLIRVHPDDREYVDLVIGQAARDHRPFSFHHRIVRPDGEIRTLHGRGEVTLDPTGRPIRMRGTGQDVTELKRTEKDLANRTAELERSNAELERFAYVASHDLQEPLRAVASHVQILEQDYRGRLDPEADESIRCAVEGARRMHDLINDYLAYSRVRSGSGPHLLIAAEGALRAALQNLERTIGESGAEVTHDDMPEVVADSTQLVQLFQNLIANAVKFRGDDPPRVHVSAARADKTWLFSVRDNGIGIDPEHTGRIFSMFQRLHTQDRYPGTGIGLAICKKIVECHGGRIWVESMPGMGATFRFTLPVCAQDHSADALDRDDTSDLATALETELGEHA